MSVTPCKDCWEHLCSDCQEAMARDDIPTKDWMANVTKALDAFLFALRVPEPQRRAVWKALVEGAEGAPDAEPG